VAGHDLIEDYLAALHDELGWCPDVDDVVAEARDHLWSAADVEASGGADAVTAQAVALTRFGDAALVARALATTPHGGLAIPTHFTRDAGAMAIGAAVLWPLVLVCWMVSGLLDDGDWGPVPMIPWLAGVGCLLSGVGLTLVAMMALGRRLGGFGPVGRIGMVLVGVALPAAIMAWFTLGWSALVGLGVTLCAVAAWPARLAPRWALLVVGTAGPIAAVTRATLRSLEVGQPDEWGDYPVATYGSISVLAGLLCVGLWGLGQWLRHETPASLGAPARVPSR
jgi:hypothetical protein